jgi:hypothetical protein
MSTGSTDLQWDSRHRQPPRGVSIVTLGFVDARQAWTRIRRTLAVSLPKGDFRTSPIGVSGKTQLLHAKTHNSGDR